MKMKNVQFYIRIVCVVATLFVLQSCKKFLIEEPRNSTYNEVFWTDARAGENAIAGNYALLRNALVSGFFDTGNRYYMYGDMAANAYIGVWRDGYYMRDIGNGALTANYIVQEYGNWTVFFKSIAMSNIILKEMPLVSDEILLTEYDNPESFKRKIMGQAYFLRAFAYFMMTRVWGDVPLVTEADDDPVNAPHLGRSPKSEVWKQIEDDCHQAAALLEWGTSSVSEVAVIANKGAAYALLAHLYLWRATTTDLNTDQPILADVHSADTTIDALIANGGYRRADTARYGEIFVGRSPETIFELNMSENTLEGSEEHIGMKFLNNTFIPTYRADAAYFVPPAYLSSHFYELKTEEGWVWNEAAWAWEWGEVTTRVLDTTDVRFKNNFLEYRADRPILKKYANVTFRNPGQQLDPYLSNNMTLFRLSDMLLLKAEIALYQDDPAAATTIINEFRAHYGASPAAQLTQGLSKAEVMTEYILERGKELYMEGHIFWDLVRTRKCFDIIPWLTEQRFRQGGFYWPVDPRLFSENRHLVQTEYWRGKI